MDVESVSRTGFWLERRHESRLNRWKIRSNGRVFLFFGAGWPKRETARETGTQYIVHASENILQ
jgi:hypothetical protein